MTRSLEVLISVVIVFPLFLFILFFPIVAGGGAITRGVPLFLFVLVLDRIECFVQCIAVITRSGFFRINFAVLFSGGVVGQNQWAGTQAKGNANDTELFEKFLGHHNVRSLLRLRSDACTEKQRSLRCHPDSSESRANLANKTKKNLYNNNLRYQMVCQTFYFPQTTVVKNDT